MDILERYDEIFFNKERISELIDEFVLKRKPLKSKALEVLLCTYIHDRVTMKSDVIPMSLHLIINLETIVLQEFERNVFKEMIESLCSALELNPLCQEYENKIYITLY